MQITQLKKISLYIRIGIYVLILLLVFAKEKSKVMSYPENPELLDRLPVADCGVVLTGAAGRIREAFEVFAQKKFKKLIISGVYKDTQLREIFPHLPFYPEVNPEDVVLEKISGSTYANANQSLLIAETLKCRSLLLMTSDIHMYRAYRTFKAVFPESIQIRPYHISNTGHESTTFDIYFETLKTIFYDIVLFFASFIK